MARYIDAEKLKDDFCEACSTHKRYRLTVEQCRATEKEQPDRKWCFKMRLIDNTPTADVVEVKHGEWRKVKDSFPRYVCTCCHHLYNNMGYKYYPNCGAKMDGGNAE